MTTLKGRIGAATQATLVMLVHRICESETCIKRSRKNILKKLCRSWKWQASRNIGIKSEEDWTFVDICNHTPTDQKDHWLENICTLLDTLETIEISEPLFWDLIACFPENVVKSWLNNKLESKESSYHTIDLLRDYGFSY